MFYYYILSTGKSFDFIIHKCHCKPSQLLNSAKLSMQLMSQLMVLTRGSIKRMLLKMIVASTLMVVSMLPSADGFSVQSNIGISPSSRTIAGIYTSYSKSMGRQPYFVAIPPTKRAATSLFMYNLPPGRNNNDLGDILKGAVSLILVVTFFASPLGGFVLGIFNSFLLLTLSLPVIGTIVVSTWQYFNTITGNCPNCGAPVRVLKSDKSGDGQPSICVSCGSTLQANYDNSGIDNITGRNTVDDLSGSPLRGSIFDMLGGPSMSRTSTTTRYQETEIPPKDKLRREGTIIDVEIDNDDSWQ